VYTLGSKITREVAEEKWPNRMQDKENCSTTYPSSIMLTRIPPAATIAPTAKAILAGVQVTFLVAMVCDYVFLFARGGSKKGGGGLEHEHC
jgi:hypothetical protein